MCVLHVVCFHLSSFFVERFSDPDTFQVSFIQTFIAALERRVNLPEKTQNDIINC